MKYYIPLSNIICLWEFFSHQSFDNEQIGNIHSFNTFLFYAYSAPRTILGVKVTKINIVPSIKKPTFGKERE